MLTALLQAVPTIASIAGGLFGKKDKQGQSISQVPLIPESQQMLGDALSKYFLNMFQGGGSLANYIPGQAYSGQLSAGATPSENTSQALLQKYMQGSGTGNLFNQASGQISDTLSGKYSNPATSPFIQAISDLAKRNLQGGIDQSRAGYGARGNFFSTASLANESKLTGNTLANLNAVIGDFANNERNRQFNSVPIAQALDQYQNQTIPLSQIEAGSTYGSLGRTLQQSDYERQYQDYLRQRGEQQGAIGQAQNQYTAQVPYGIKDFTAPNTQQNNSLGNILGVLGQLNYSNLSDKQGILQNLGSLFKFGGA